MVYVLMCVMVGDLDGIGLSALDGTGRSVGISDGAADVMKLGVCEGVGIMSVR